MQGVVETADDPQFAEPEDSIRERSADDECREYLRAGVGAIRAGM